MKTILGQRNDDKEEIVKYWAVTFTKFLNYQILFDKIKRKLVRSHFISIWTDCTYEYSKALTYVVSADSYRGL